MRCPRFDANPPAPYLGDVRPVPRTCLSVLSLTALGATVLAAAGCGKESEPLVATGGLAPTGGGGVGAGAGAPPPVRGGAPSGGAPSGGAPSGGDSTGGYSASGGTGGGGTGGGGRGGDAAGGAGGIGGGDRGGAGGSSGGLGGSEVGGGGTGGDGLGGEPGAGGTAGATSGGEAGTGATCVATAPTDREQPPYPAIDEAEAGCGSWALVDNVCCAQYCASVPTSESCDACEGTSDCVAVSSKGCISGKWPEGRCVTDDEPWHYSRSTHYGLTTSGACGFGYYGLCATSDKVSFGDSGYATQCEAFCQAYPDLCADPPGTTLRGNFAAPQGNYYTQFWPELPGDRDNYLSCGECFEILRTRPDGSEYQPGEAGYTSPIVIQVTDSCPCSANSKWCCGSGRDHCAEVTTDPLDFAHGCPLPPGDLPLDHDPQPDESIHIDLGDIAMARLQTGDPNLGAPDGVIPTRYRRVPCPVVGNIHVWLRPQASEYYFALTVVNVARAGSVVAVEAKLATGDWAALQRDANYTSSRPQERYGTWVVPQGVGPFPLPVSLRFTAPDGTVLEAPDAIQAFTAVAPAPDAEMYFIDTGVQFP